VGTWALSSKLGQQSWEIRNLLGLYLNWGAEKKDTSIYHLIIQSINVHLI
jgi:hypothetical protein